jgi:hypothetical protein
MSAVWNSFLTKDTGLERTTTHRLTQFLKSKINEITFFKRTNFFLAGMKAPGEKAGGRILLGVSMFGAWISAELL